MKYEIDLQEKYVGTDGKEYVPTGEFRKPKRGEWIVFDTHAEVMLNDSDAFHLILKEKWTWPWWLSGWGFALDNDGKFYWYEHRPVKFGKYWSPKNETMAVQITDNVRLMFPSLPPLPTDWTKPILNPNYVSPNKEDDGTEHDPE